MTPSGPRTATRDQLRTAWLGLTPDQRLVLRLLYNLDGQGALSPSDTLRVLQRTKSRMGLARVTELELTAIDAIRESIWPSHYFPGLSTLILNRLLNADVTRPDQLPDRIDDLVLNRGLGARGLDLLTSWLISHKHEAIAQLLLPRLSSGARAKLRRNGHS